MAAEAQVKITADAASFQRGMASVSSTMDAFAGQMRMVGNVVKAALGYAAMRSIVGAAAEAEQAQFKLSQALRLTGQNAAEIMPRFTEVANEIRKSTTVGDEAVMEMMRYAVQMGRTAKETETLVRASVALSAVTGGEAAENLKALVMAQEGEYALLGRMLPTIRALTTDEERLAELNRILTLGWQSQSDAQKTLIERWQMFKNSAGEILEQMGNVFLPLIKTGLEALTPLAEGLAAAFEKMNAKLEPLQDYIRGLGPVIKEWGLDMLAAAAAVADNLKAAFELAATAMELAFERGLHNIADAVMRILPNAFDAATFGLAKKMALAEWQGRKPLPPSELTQSPQYRTGKSAAELARADATYAQRQRAQMDWAREGEYLLRSTDTRPKGEPRQPSERETQLEEALAQGAKSLADSAAKWKEWFRAQGAPGPGGEPPTMRDGVTRYAPSGPSKSATALAEALARGEKEVANRQAADRAAAPSRSTSAEGLTDAYWRIQGALMSKDPLTMTAGKIEGSVAKILARLEKGGSTKPYEQPHAVFAP